MNISDFFQPDWKHSDPQIRRAAVEKLDVAADYPVLMNLAAGDVDASVRLVAIARIERLDDLARLAACESDSAVQTDLQQRMAAIAYDLILAGCEVGSATANLPYVTDPQKLGEIAVTVEDDAVRLAAVERIEDADRLVRITKKNCGRTVGIAIVERLNDIQHLRDIATHAANKKVRMHADGKVVRMTAQANKPTPEQLADQAIESILSEARGLSESWNWDFAIGRLQDLEASWPDGAPGDADDKRRTFAGYYNRLQERYRDFQLSHAEVERKASLRQGLLDECDAVCSLIESLDPPSEVDTETDAAFATACGRWQDIDIPEDDEDFEERSDRFATVCDTFRQTTARRRLEHREHVARMAEVTALCESAEACAERDDFAQAKKDLAELKRTWPSWMTDPKPGFEEFQARFLAASDRLAARQKSQKESARQRIDNELRRLEALCDEVVRLNQETDRYQAERRVKEIVREWHEGAAESVIRDDSKIALNRRFRKICDTFFDAQHAFREEQEWERWSNLMIKEELCHAVERLSQESDIFKVSRELKQAQKTWKTIGATPKNRSKETWEHFRTACDRAHKRCKTFFAELEQKRIENLRIKDEICTRITQLTEDGKNWNDATREVKELQAKWQKIGKAPREKEDAVFKRYRAAADAFFNKRRDYLKAQRVQRREAGEAKEALCDRLDLLEKEADWFSAIAEIKQLQAEWKTIGPANREREKALWLRFRGSCDRFFKRLDDERPANLSEKKRIISDIETLVGDLKQKGQELDLAHVTDAAKSFSALQAVFKAVGPVPRESERDTWQRYHKAGDAFFQFRRSFFKELSHEREQCLAQKEELVFNAETLAESTDWDDAEAGFKKLDEQWTCLGALPGGKDKELKARYQIAQDRFRNRRRYHSGDMEADREEILKKKETLCTRLELLAGGNQSANADANIALSLSDQLKLAIESNFASSTMTAPYSEKFNWQSAHDEAKKIQDEWTSLDAQSNHRDLALEDRFKRALDGFFARRPSTTKRSRKDVSPAEMAANLVAKEEICTQVETFAAADDPKTVVAKVKKCQARWKTLGPVARKNDADRLWSRYSTACDKVFESLRARSSNIHA